jgi:hypothetical protein
MSSEMSPMMRALLDAGKNDRPDSKSREQMWQGVEKATELAASAGSVASIAATSKTTSIVAGGVAKAMAIGLAAVVTIGASLTLLHAHRMRGAEDAYNAQNARVDGDRSSHVSDARRVTILPHAIATDSFAVAEEARAIPSSAAKGTSSIAIVPEDTLMREASLVSDARSALRRGDAQMALTLVRQTSSLPSRELEPEELSLEASALRALGQNDEAIITEMRLRLRFPDHALVGGH